MESREYVTKIKEAIAVQLVDGLVPHIDKLKQVPELPNIVFILFDSYIKSSDRVREIAEEEEKLR